MTNKNFFNLIFFFIYIIFFVIFFYQYLGPDKLPGDTGDGKIIIGVLENLYLAFNNEEFSYLKSTFLYPFKNSIFFSETLWGVGWLYLILRELGLDIFSSYKLLFFIVFILNYISCYYCCKKLDLSFKTALFASFLFTFSLPIVAQDSHFSLIFRACIPLCLTNLILYFKTKNSNYVFYFIIFFTIQIFCGIYTSIFLFIVSIVTVIVYTYHENTQIIKELNQEIKKIYYDFNFKKKFFIIILSILIIFYLSQYILVMSVYEFTRGYPDKALINLFSFITTDRSIFWPNRLIPKGYPVHEQQLYLGISVLIIFMVLIYRFNNLKVDQNLFLMSKISLFSILCFFSFFGLSIFFFIHLLPGFNGLRVPSRSILIILFPLSIFLAMGIDKILKQKNSYNFLFLSLVIFLLIETSFAKKVTSSIKNENLRTEKLSKYFLNSNKSDILVFKNDKEEDIGKFLVKEFDITFLSSRYGIKTLNGWSSFIPQNYHPLNTCDKVKKNLDEISNIYEKKNIKYKKIDYKKLKFIGFSNDCKNIFNN